MLSAKFFSSLSLFLGLVVFGSSLPRNLRTELNTYNKGNSNDKIVGGSEVAANSIPYQVSIQYKNVPTEAGFAHFCGGALIDNNTVLTGAHCCTGHGSSDIQVALGEHNLFQEDGTERVMNVRKMKVHEDFNPYVNDICLVQLSRDLNLFTTAIKPVTLPAQGTLFLSGTATVSGWGALVVDGDGPDVLHSVQVPIVSDDECASAYGTSFERDIMMCAGSEGLDSCQRDSGGPLTCDGDDAVHCGIVSWGYGCGVAGFPGVYTETAMFRDWIEENND